MKTSRPKSVFTPAQLAARAVALPVMTYPDLPVSEYREQIAAAIKEHQVVIVSGETGSGKTTQLPKICLELGRGIAGIIGHTQPRRIAARAVAERIAEELGTHVGREPGDIIGYQVRFTDEVGPTTLVKLMTDGILLAEIGTDPLLKKYDTIIVDEAHERSLNIDFILGYLATLLPKRPDLKVIITSATIDSARFAEHFGSLTGAHVPVIEVSGRAYPVEVRYRPLSADIAPSDVQETEGAASAGSVGTVLERELDGGDLPELGYGLGEDLDLETALCEAVDELLQQPEGDILVFLPGERDIREAEAALSESLGARYVKDPKKAHRADGVEIVPLFARLSAAEQHRIYAPHSLRRVVLSTNIAETSLTVPNVRYVIDSGLARISRFSNKTKVQRLPIERVSQASASQRAGRAGRIAPGIAVRLYSERDHRSQPEFTEPEILRTSLASVILQMSVLGLGSVADFPFLDRPNSRAVRDGIGLLVEIGALDQYSKVTKLGRRLARLPIDPRLGRMLLEAEKLGCASEVLVIVAALSIQDVRERPLDRQQQADQAHARFADRTSDFITYLNMWRYLNVMSRDLSGSAFRRLCKAEFFHYLRYREWRDIVSQIRRMCQQLGIHVDKIGLPSGRSIAAQQNQEHPAVAAVLQYGEGPGSVSPDQVHRAILSGLLSNIGNWDETKRNYQGARGSRFTIWPGSALRRRTPAWVMAAELVETSRLFARTVASIRPEWIEEYAGELAKRSYSEPVWSRSRGSATVKERITLYGLTLAADRAVPLTELGNTAIGRTYLGAEVEVTARTLAREMFISNALVDGEWRENHHGFVKHNQRVMVEAEDLSSRLRDPSLVPDESARYRFFDSRIPQNITSAASFNRWWKERRRSEPHLLDYILKELLPSGTLLDPDGFPDAWIQGDLSLPLTYSFDPGAEQDGVIVSIPLSVLPSVREQGFDWLVPGLQRELCVALIRGLPKSKRRLLAPAVQAGEVIWRRMMDESQGRVPSVEDSVSSGNDEDETDPYSLEASLDRLKSWGSAGQVRATKGDAKKPLPTLASDSEPSVRSKSVRTRTFSEAFAHAVRGAKGIELTSEDMRESERSLPPHLRVGFRVVDDRGAIVGVSDSLPELQNRFRRQADQSVDKAVRGALAEAAKQNRKDVTPAPVQKPATFKDEPVKELPEVSLPTRVENRDTGGMLVRGYPALVRTPQGSYVRVFGSLDEAHREHEKGLVWLLLDDLRLEEGRVTTRWSGREALMLAASPYPNTSALVQDAQVAAMTQLVRELTADRGAFSIRDRSDYLELRALVRDRLEDRIYLVLGGVIRAAESYSQVQKALQDSGADSMKYVVRGVRNHSRRLFRDGYLTSTPASILANLPRYLQADARRLETASRGPQAIRDDSDRAEELREVEQAFEEARVRAAARPYSRSMQRNLEEVEMLLEELRVSLFAQSLGTSQRVSSTRLLRRLAGIERNE